MASIHIYKSSGGGMDVKIDESTVLQQRLFGENVITSTFTARQVLNLSIGDYIVYDNIKYYINILPNVTKNATNNYEYTITFESQYYDLAKAQFMYDSMGEFDFAGTAEDFIDILITNLARVFGAGVWTKGTVNPTNTDVKLLHFSAVNCAEAMVTLSNEFSGEFYYDDKEISFTDEVGSDIAVTLEYRAGLFNFTRNTVDSKNIITRIYPFGSQKNIDITSYGYDRLRPTPDGGNYYFDQNTDAYGIIEHTKIFEDVFPTRTGTITSVNGGNILKFTDSGMDFNLNDYLLPGVTAKIHFQTGDLGGYEFEIVSYNNSTKEFEIAEYEDGQGFTLPEAPLVVAVDDTYKLIDIKMPASYITTAEDLLQTKALAYLAENSSARVSYSLQPDWKYLKTNGIDIKIGDFIRVRDTDMGITSLLRVVYLSRQVMNQWKCTLELSDDYVVSLPQRVYADNVRNKRRLEFDNIGDVINHRRNWRSTEELREMVFDPDGYFDVDSNIRPLSVTTAMLSVGVGSQQFTLSSDIQPNYTGDASKVETGTGYLAHFTIDPTGIQTWTLYANSYSGLTAGTAYYIYAKCHKTDYTNANNEIVIDATERTMDGDATYYYFLIGVLHSVVDSVRGISLTYGQTTINGKFVTTGKIQSANGNTYFDLDNNMLVIGNASGYANITDKPTLGNMAAEDLVEYAKLGTTVINGGYLQTALIDADYIQAGTLTGRTVQTASSGARVVVSGVDNNIILYNSSGGNLLRIDDTLWYDTSPGIEIIDDNPHLYMRKSDNSRYSDRTSWRTYIESDADGDIFEGIASVSLTPPNAIFRAKIDAGHTGNFIAGLLGSTFKYQVDETGHGIFVGGAEFRDNVSITTGYIDVAGGYKESGTIIITTDKVLQNVTLSASLINAGTLGAAYLPNHSAALVTSGTMSSARVKAPSDVNKACYFASDGVLTASAITSTELGYLDNVSSNIQTQLNSLDSRISALEGAGVPAHSLVDHDDVLDSMSPSGGDVLTYSGAYSAWDAV